MRQDTLEALRYFSDFSHEESFVLLPGRGAVMVSAPHAVVQTRNGGLKQAERYTGMLCLLLNRRYGVPCIYKARHMQDDANHDAQSPYRDALCEHIQHSGARCVLDLHQLAPRRAMALCIGTGHGRNLNGFTDAPMRICRIFKRHALTPVTLDDPFAASAPYTVSATVARMGVPALQLELNTRFLLEGYPDEQFENVLAALHEAVLALQAC